MFPKELQQWKVLKLHVSLILQPLWLTHYNSLPCVIFCVGENQATISSGSPCTDEGWYKNLLSEMDAKILDHSGKMVLLFEILRMAEDLDDKVYVSFRN